MTSGAQDWQKEHCEQICGRLKYPIENVSGLTTLENYLSIVWNAKLVLTVEGSAGHIAAALSAQVCHAVWSHQPHSPPQIHPIFLCDQYWQSIGARLPPGTPARRARDYGSHRTLECRRISC
jgi:hypothetical protein